MIQFDEHIFQMGWFNRQLVLDFRHFWQRHTQTWKRGQQNSFDRFPIFVPTIGARFFQWCLEKDSCGIKGTERYRRRLSFIEKSFIEKSHGYMQMGKKNYPGISRIVCILCRWWFQIFFIFNSTWGRFSFWRIFFELGWSHQLVMFSCIKHVSKSRSLSEVPRKLQHTPISHTYLGNPLGQLWRESRLTACWERFFRGVFQRCVPRINKPL